MYSRLQDKIELLADDLGKRDLTERELLRLHHYQSLIKQVKAELNTFQTFTATTLENAATEAVGLAQNHSLRLMAASAESVGLTAQFNRLPKNAIIRLLGFLDRDGPLFDRLNKLAGSNAEHVASEIVQMVGLGMGPREIAEHIRDALGGGLTDALRMTRTVQLYSYREATRAYYVANSDVVSGWVWHAELDDNTCASCIAQHGSVHPLTETLNDHHNGRCAMVPSIGGDNPVAPGRDWFDSLSEAEQRSILGKGRYEAFKAGKFEFSDLSKERPDDVYGKMRSEATLKELVK